MSNDAQTTVYEDVFEAIRFLEPTNPVLNKKDQGNGRLVRSNVFQLFGLENGKGCALPQSSMLLTHYRGEAGQYDTCFPSIYRGNPSDEEIMINRLKLLDFRDICKTFPSVQFAERDRLDVQYDAIAQHYGLKTDIIDLTSDIVVAAFFATHGYDAETDSYSPLSNGIGVIRNAIGLEFTIYTNEPTSLHFKTIGVQPFYRTAQQHAFGCLCEAGADFTSMSCPILFKQNAKMSEKIESVFFEDGTNTLFPQELIIQAAKAVSSAYSITESSVREYAAAHSKSISEIQSILKDNGYTIASSPVFKLSRQQKRFLERQVEKDPYGGIQFTTRLHCHIL